MSGYRVRILTSALLATLLMQVPSSRSQDAALNPLSTLDPETLRPFLDKPLFSPRRMRPQPVQPEIVVDPNAASNSPDLKLVGVLVTPKDRVAQVVSTKDNSGFSLRVGDFVGDWKVAVIEPRSIRMKSEGREVSLTLE